MTDITYRVEGDHLIPNLVLDDETGDNPREMIGRYGALRTFVEILDKYRD